MPTTYLPLEDHIARHIKPRLILRDENTNEAIGIFPEAFALRDGERDLSVSWLEFFGEGEDRVKQLKKVMAHTELQLNRRHGFAVLQVGALVDACTAHDAKVRVIHEPTDGNPAHSSVHRYPRDKDELAAVLANLASEQLTLVSDLLG